MLRDMQPDDPVMGVLRLPKAPTGFPWGCITTIGSPPFLLDGDDMLWHERSGVGVRFRTQANIQGATRQGEQHPRLGGRVRNAAEPSCQDSALCGNGETSTSRSVESWHQAEAAPCTTRHLQGNLRRGRTTPRPGKDDDPRNPNGVEAARDRRREADNSSCLQVRSLRRNPRGPEPGQEAEARRVDLDRPGEAEADRATSARRQAVHQAHREASRLRTGHSLPNPKDSCFAEAA